MKTNLNNDAFNDAIFDDAMKTVGVSWWKRTLIYYAYRLFRIFHRMK